MRLGPGSAGVGVPDRPWCSKRLAQFWSPILVRPHGVSCGRLHPASTVTRLNCGGRPLPCHKETALGTQPMPRSVGLGRPSAARSSSTVSGRGHPFKDSNGREGVAWTSGIAAPIMIPSTKKLSQNLNHKCIDRFLGRFVWFLQKHREGPHGETRDARVHLASTGRALGNASNLSSWRKTRPQPGAASALTHDRCSTASSTGCAAGADGTDCRKNLGSSAPFIAPFNGGWGRASCTECGQPWWRGAKSWMAWTGNGRRQTEPWARHVLGGPD